MKIIASVMVSLVFFVWSLPSGLAQSPTNEPYSPEADPLPEVKLLTQPQSGQNASQADKELDSLGQEHDAFSAATGSSFKQTSGKGFTQRFGRALQVAAARRNSRYQRRRAAYNYRNPLVSSYQGGFGSPGMPSTTSLGRGYGTGSNVNPSSQMGGLSGFGNGGTAMTTRSPMGSFTTFSNGGNASTTFSPSGSSFTAFSNGVTANTMRSPSGSSFTTFSNGQTASTMRSPGGNSFTTFSNGGTANTMRSPSGNTFTTFSHF